MNQDLFLDQVAKIGEGLLKRLRVPIDVQMISLATCDDGVCGLQLMKTSIEFIGLYHGPMSAIADHQIGFRLCINSTQKSVAAFRRAAQNVRQPS